METLAWLGFSACLALVMASWFGYPLLLSLLPKQPTRSHLTPEWPQVTVLLTVHNEAALIVRRLQNLLEQDYPPDCLHILVASDGSTDHTADEARSVADPRIIVREYPAGGKSVAQNAALTEIADGIVVFTDLETLFAPDFLREVVRPFSNPAVGCVTGRLIVTRQPGAISANQSLYWRFEMWLRKQECQAGILATASGPCMAVRRSLFRPLSPAYGEDCMVPLDVLAEGWRVAHAERAVAYDVVPGTLRGELCARARMTSRNLAGILSRRPLLNPLKHPGYALGLWAHKILRWLTPFLLGLAFLLSLLLYPRTRWIVCAELFYIALCALGALLERRRACMPAAVSAAFSFLLANIGFFLGVLRALRGQRTVRYVNLPG